jgi:hypothetical protein
MDSLVLNPKPGRPTSILLSSSPGRFQAIEGPKSRVGRIESRNGSDSAHKLCI